MKQTSSTAGTQIEKVTYANSNSKAYNKAYLAGGWLRIYYGIATGKVADDATGASPITNLKAYGQYSGQVTITLTP